MVFSAIIPGIAPLRWGLLLGMLALASPFVSTGPAIAQDRGTEVTIRKGIAPYYGRYGSELPGVYMLSNSGLAISPDINSGKLRTPSGAPVEYYTTLTRPIPTIDGWNGTMGWGFPLD